MKLTTKLISYLHRAFDKDPDGFLALRIRRSGGLAWVVEDGVLTFSFLSGTLVIDLSQHTIGSLAGYIANQSGFSVEYMATESHVSALVLLDGSGNQDSSNGDHLYGYASLLWSYMEPVAVELVRARQEIENMLDQLSITSADGEWLDEWGGYFGILRNAGETDVAYGNRIVVEVLRPRENNVAMEMAISEAFGSGAKVTDVRLWGLSYPRYNSAITHNSAEQHDGDSVPIYGLFDVEYDYNLESGTDMAEYANALRAFVANLRAAGTHLRSLLLRSSVMRDSALGPSSDTISVGVGVALQDSVSAPTEAHSQVISLNHTYSGIRLYDGYVNHNSGSAFGESL